MMRTSLVSLGLFFLCFTFQAHATYTIEQLADPTSGDLTAIIQSGNGNLIWQQNTTINNWNGKYIQQLETNYSITNSSRYGRVFAANDNGQYVTRVDLGREVVDGVYYSIIELYLHSAEKTELVANLRVEQGYLEAIEITQQGDVIWLVHNTKEISPGTRADRDELYLKNSEGTHLLETYDANSSYGVNLHHVGWNSAGHIVWQSSYYDTTAKTNRYTIKVWDGNQSHVVLNETKPILAYQLTDQGMLYFHDQVNFLFTSYDIINNTLTQNAYPYILMSIAPDGTAIGMNSHPPGQSLLYFDGINTHIYPNDLGSWWLPTLLEVNGNNQFFLGTESETKRQLIIIEDGIIKEIPFIEDIPYISDTFNFNELGQVSWINWTWPMNTLDIYDGETTQRIAESQQIYFSLLTDKGFLTWVEVIEYINEYGYPEYGTVLKVAYKELPNTAPIANAGQDQQTYTGNTIQLDGSNSSDEDGDSLSYSWSITSTPIGSNAQLVNANALMPSVTPDMEGTYVFSLIVNDGTNDSVADEVVVTVITPEAYATNTTTETIAVINDSSIVDPTTDLNNENNATALSNKLNAVIADIDAGNIDLALDKLQNDLLPKTDGCALRGSPDISGKGGITKDWVTDCDAQATLYPLILSIIETLQ